MRLEAWSRAVRRTTPFRLALGFGLAFLLSTTLMLGLVYLRTASYLTRRVDLILASEARVFSRSTPGQVLDRLRLENRRDPLNSFALFAQTGERIGGEAPLSPSDLPQDGSVREIQPSGGQEAYRAMVLKLPWGETLVLARDADQLVELRRVLLETLAGGGVGLSALGVAAGVVLSRDPLRRIAAMHSASEKIVQGDLSARLPVGPRHDELDALAAIVNAMMTEVERLVLHARTAGESVAHELRTPLTHLRATLERAAGDLADDDPRRPLMERCVAETDAVLARFRGLLRIAAVEAKRRRAAIAPVRLGELVEQVGELYQPLAEAKGLAFHMEIAAAFEAAVDRELFFEAVANLVDNAIKFTPAGGVVSLALREEGGRRVVTVRDTGPGVPAAELPLVTRRFYRGAGHAATPGHGLGLSLVAAVAEMHGATLELDSGTGGTIARLVL